MFIAVKALHHTFPLLVPESLSLAMARLPPTVWFGFCNHWNL